MAEKIPAPADNPALIARVARGDVPLPAAREKVEGLSPRTRERLRDLTIEHVVPALVALGSVIAQRVGVADAKRPELSEEELRQRRPAVRGLAGQIARGVLTWLALASAEVVTLASDDARADGIDLEDEEQALAVTVYVQRMLVRAWCSTQLVGLATFLIGDQVEALSLVEEVSEELPAVVAPLPGELRGVWLRDPAHDPASGARIVAAAAELLGEDPAPADARTVAALTREAIARAQMDVLSPPEDIPGARAIKGGCRPPGSRTAQAWEAGLGVLTVDVLTKKHEPLRAILERHERQARNRGRGADPTEEPHELEQARWRRRQGLSEVALLEDPDLRRGPGADPSAEAAARDAEELALGGLTLRRRLVFELRLRGKSWPEIARRVGCSPRTAREDYDAARTAAAARLNSYVDQG